MLIEQWQKKNIHFSRPKKVVWSEQGSAPTQQSACSLVSFSQYSIFLSQQTSTSRAYQPRNRPANRLNDSIQVSARVFYGHLCYKKDHMLYMCTRNKRKTDPDPYVMETVQCYVLKCSHWSAAHWWGMEARAVFGGSNKPTQGGLTLQIVTMVPSWSYYNELRLTCFVFHYECW